MVKFLRNISSEWILFSSSKEILNGVIKSVKKDGEWKVRIRI